MTDYGKNIVFGTLIVLFFSVISTIFGFLVKTIMARLIDVELIGLFFSVLGFVTFFTFIRDLGLSDALIYFIPRFLVDNNKKNIKKVILLTLRTQLFFGFLFFILFSLFSGILAKYYFKNDKAVYLLIFLGVYFFLDGLHEVLLRIFHGYKNYLYLQGIDFMFQFFSSIFILIILFFSKDILFFGLAYVLAEIMAVVFFFYIFLKKIFPDFFKINVNVNKKFSKKIFNFSLPTMIATIGEISYSQQTIFFLTFFSGLETVGYYVMINSLAKLSLFLYKAISRTFAPLISEMWKKQEIDKLNFYFKEMFVLVFVVAIPIILTIVFFPETIISLIFGEKFLVSENALIIVACSFLFNLINSIYNNCTIAIGKPELYRNNVYFKFFSNFLLNIFLIPNYKLLGAVISDIVSIIIATIHIYYYNIKIGIFKFPLREFKFLTISTFGFILSIFVFKFFLKNFTINIFLKSFFILLFSGLIYLLFLFLFKLVIFNKLREIIKLLIKY